eukprot:gene10959-biopygen21359
MRDHASCSFARMRYPWHPVGLRKSRESAAPQAPRKDNPPGNTKYVPIDAQWRRSMNWGWAKCVKSAGEPLFWYECASETCKTAPKAPGNLPPLTRPHVLPSLPLIHCVGVHSAPTSAVAVFPHALFSFSPTLCSPAVDPSRCSTPNLLGVDVGGCLGFKSAVQGSICVAGRGPRQIK